MACAGFIFGEAEKKFRGGQKKMRGAESCPKGGKKISAPLAEINSSPPPADLDSAPPAEFDSAPRAEQTRGGAENLIIPRERGRNV